MQGNQAEGVPLSSAGRSFSPKHGGRSMAASILTFDLQTEAEQLRAQPGYAAKSPVGRTLVKEPDLRIVLIALRADGHMREHHASGPVSVQVLEGVIRLRVGDDAVELSPGRLLTMEPGMRHDVDALQDSLFLLTIGRTTYERVSELHEPGTSAS